MTATDPERRAFLVRCGKAAVVAAAAAATGIVAHRTRPPRITPVTDADTVLPDYRVADRAGRMAVVRGEGRDATLTAALKALGGLSGFVVPGDRVLLKVNAAFASPPALNATTHPDLVAALVHRCREAGAADIVVSDNPINDPASCFRLSGIQEAAERAGARVALPRPADFGPATVPGGRLIRRWPTLLGPLAGITKVIGLAPLKDHHRSGASMTLKNWYGLLGGRRNVFHQDIHTIIAELGLLVRPTLVVLDATVAMIANGPTGGSLSDLKPTRTLIAGTDPVAVDAFGATLLGRTGADLPFLARTEAAGGGTTDWPSLKPAMITL